jgi:hypothetical protein
MKKFRLAFLVLFVSMVIFSCSKKEDAKPTSSVLFFIKSTATLTSYVDVEFNGKNIGRITAKSSAEPNCTDATNNRIIKVSGVEVEVEQIVRFLFSDNRIIEGKFTIPSTITSNQCWSSFVE